MDNLDLGYMFSVMQAAKEGKKIESRRLPNLTNDPEQLKWSDCDNPWWDWTRNTYRVKDEPAAARRVFLVTNRADNRFCVFYDPRYEGIPSDTNECFLVEFIELTPEVREKLGL